MKRPHFTDPAEVLNSTYIRQGFVTNIVDGDTIDLDISLGFKLRMQQRFRLYGINTPERGEKNWAEAKALLAELAPIGTEVSIRSYKPNVLPKADSFGRWVVEIFVGDTNVNQALLNSGLARPFTRDGK